MNIMYIHGFASGFSENHPKVAALRKLGKVYGMTFDYTDYPLNNVDKLVSFINENEIDLIVGTSMGGWLAAIGSSITGVPFIGINPSITPQITLLKHVGKGKNYHDGSEYEMTIPIAASYNSMSLNGDGVIFLELGDTVIDPLKTIEYVGDKYTCKVFEGGSHRFENMDAVIEYIETNYG